MMRKIKTMRKTKQKGNKLQVDYDHLIQLWNDKITEYQAEISKYLNLSGEFWKRYQIVHNDITPVDENGEPYEYYDLYELEDNPKQQRINEQLETIASNAQGINADLEHKHYYNQDVIEHKQHVLLYFKSAHNPKKEIDEQIIIINNYISDYHEAYTSLKSIFTKLKSFHTKILKPKNETKAKSKGNEHK